MVRFLATSRLRVSPAVLLVILRLKVMLLNFRISSLSMRNFISSTVKLKASLKFNSALQRMSSTRRNSRLNKIRIKALMKLRARMRKKKSSWT